jgi:hypothetical protein
MLRIKHSKAIRIIYLAAVIMMSMGMMFRLATIPVLAQDVDPTPDPVEEQISDPVDDPTEEPTEEAPADPTEEPLADPTEEPVLEPQQMLSAAAATDPDPSVGLDDLPVPINDPKNPMPECSQNSNLCKGVDGAGIENGTTITGVPNATIVVIKAGTNLYFFTPTGPDCTQTSYCVTWNDDGSVTVVRHGDGPDVKEISGITVWDPSDPGDDDDDTGDDDDDTGDDDDDTGDDDDDTGDDDDDVGGDDDDVTVEALPIPVTGAPQTALIPVTGADHTGSSTLALLQSLFFNFGLATLGFGMVLHGYSKKRMKH